MPHALKISESLSLPIDAATQTFAFIARKGAGKTYAAGKLAECLLDAGVQVVVLDSVGNWWGLRLSADGKSAAYDVPVIGGLRGDVPLEAAGGHLIADIVIETGRSLIIDVSQFSKKDRQRFAMDFGERLWLKKKAERQPSPLFLIIEESQLIVPEAVKSDSARMVGIYEEIIRLGRNYGIGVGMISQRPQSVNKEVLNQTECLFVLQVNGAHERKALKEWIVYHGVDKGLVDELPGLPIGTAYVWSPQWLQLLQKVRIGQKKSFDASATPKVGSTQIRRDLKPLNLDDLQERMAATIEKAKAEDPHELKKKNAELQRRIGDLERVASQALPKGQPEKITERVEVPVLANGQLKSLETLISELRAIKADFDEDRVRFIGRWQELAESVERVGASIATEIAKTKISSTPQQRVAPIPSQRIMAPQQPRVVRPSLNNGEKLPPGEKATLIAAAQYYAEGVTREQCTILTGYKRSSRDAYIQRLAGKGYVEVRGPLIFATQSGIDALGSDYEPLPSGEALQEYWLNRLPPGEKATLEAAIAAYPEPIKRDALEESTGYKRSSRDAYIQRLSARKLVHAVGRGEVRASDQLFEA